MPKTLQRGELISLAQALAQVSDADPLVERKTLTIQVLRSGEFEDMNGTPFALSSADLDAFVANSNALLASEEVPIEIGHPHDAGAPASAWYRHFFKKILGGVEWVCAEIELTALGADALAKKLYKYFSANIWLDDRTIVGGGFVNRPAVTGQQPIGSLAATIQWKPTVSGKQVSQKGAPVMQTTAKPVALNTSRVARLLRQVQGILKLEMSHEDVSRKLWDALREKYGDPNDEYSWDLPWIVETFDDHVIVQKDGDTYSVAYVIEDGEAVLAEPVQVETEYVPVDDADAPALEAVAETNLARFKAPKGKSMPPTKAPVSGLPQIPTTNPLPVPEIDQSLPVDEQIRLAREQAFNAAMDHQRAFEAELARARSEAWEKAQAEMARKQNVVALAQKLTSGTRQFPYSPQDLENVLLKLSDADREIIAPVLEKIHAHGLVNMSELGSTGAGKGHRELAAFAKPLLKSFLAKGGTITEFFAANVELGSAAQYDLYEFETNRQ